MVLVQMPAGHNTTVFWQAPVWVIGTLKITGNSPHGEVSYRMSGISIERPKEF